MLNWVLAFVGSRSQLVIDGEASESMPVTLGVPKAKSWINGLPDEVYSKVRLFADDTALYPTVENELISSLFY